jgi:hypothetical protein
VSRIGNGGTDGSETAGVIEVRKSTRHVVRSYERLNDLRLRVLMVEVVSLRAHSQDKDEESAPS